MSLIRPSSGKVLWAIGYIGFRKEVRLRRGKNKKGFVGICIQMVVETTKCRGSPKDSRQ